MTEQLLPGRAALSQAAICERIVVKAGTAVGKVALAKTNKYAGN